MPYFLSQKKMEYEERNLHNAHIALGPSQKIMIVFHVFTTHLRPVFEGAEKPGIFSVPESRRKLRIFPSLRAYMEETEE